MHDVKLHGLLLTVNPMFAWMMEVKLDQVEFFAIQNYELPFITAKVEAPMVRFKFTDCRLFQLNIQTVFTEVAVRQPANKNVPTNPQQFEKC
jgi:hypothetical protein